MKKDPQSGEPFGKWFGRVDPEDASPIDQAITIGIFDGELSLDRHHPSR